MNGRVPVTLARVCAVVLALSIGAARAQSPLSPNTGVVPDDELTLVVGTRFVVGPWPEGASAKAQFDDERIPLSEFNETDHCVDQSALEIAKEYFATLGRVMGKAGHYYVVPEEEIKKSAVMCERMHAQPPKAWVGNKTKIVAFGKVVPTGEAPALEQSVR